MVRAHEPCEPARLVLAALAYGTAATTLAIVLITHAEDGPWGPAVGNAILPPLALAGYVAPLALAVRRKKHFMTKWRCFAAGCAYIAGASLYPLLTLGMLTDEPIDWRDVGLWQAVCAGLMLGGGMLGVLFGRYMRRVGAELVMQDGTLCPGCAYSLVGNTSGRCPECGRAFSFQELGTTEAEFRRRTAKAVPVDAGTAAAEGTGP
ncbi:MAG: hypothetical protein L6Q92_14235 [Phycisphaerae bacterium]|nr:hypothetical protein [Phycisphaerae bacterium]